MKSGALLSVIALAALVGCASNASLEGIKPGSITLEQMRAKEKPTVEWQNADGTVTLEYARRPVSEQNVMMDFDRNGLLTRTEAVITMENMSRLKPGMTRMDVKRIVGSPTHVWRNQYGFSEVWEYALDAPDGSLAQAVIVVYWSEQVDAALKIVRDTRFN